jgi:hypothetical protein
MRFVQGEIADSPSGTTKKKMKALADRDTNVVDPPHVKAEGS